jgi:hypothetical protein
MLWSSIPSNQQITFENLLEACNNGTFLQLLPMPPSGVSAKKCIRGDQVQSYVEIQSAPLSGTAANQTVAKSKIVAAQYTYYQLTSCGGGAAAWTRISPTLGVGQRYILPSSSPTYYYYNGTSQGPQTNIPSGYNGSIQRVSGATYCP